MSLRAVVLVVGIATVSAFSGVVVATAAAKPAQITACTSKSGDVKRLGSAVKCKSGETKVQWNQTGPSGPVGATGAAGTSTADLFKGYDVMVAGSTCPAGTHFDGAVGRYGAVDTWAQTFGSLPYKVTTDSDGARLTTDAALLPMTACKVL